MRGWASQARKLESPSMEVGWLIQIAENIDCWVLFEKHLAAIDIFARHYLHGYSHVKFLGELI